jgi:hypothetical protein
MSFAAVEIYLHELKALKCYDDVKRQRDKLAEENALLKDRVVGLEKEVNGLRAELGREVEGKTVVEEELKAEKSSTEKLDAELGKASSELSKLRELKIKSADGRSLTIEEARDEFIRARESEIEGRANQKFGMFKADLEAKMPKLIYDKLIETMGKPPWPKDIASAIEAKAGEIADGILRNKESWPGWFKEHYPKEVRAGVNAGLDAQFVQRVEGEAGARAKKKLGELATVEWPNWYNANIKPKLSDLEAKIKVNAIRALEGPLGGVKCDRCGADQGAFKLTEDGISDMLTRGYVEPECINPHCEDLPAFRRRRKHRIRISILDLIAAHIRR